MSSLYIEHFGLSKPPFQITPDLDFFFSGGRRGDILSALLHVAAHDEGIITLVAEVGSGKTLLARLMISRLPQTVCAVYLANPCFSRDEIIAAIARDLGLTELGQSMEGKLAALRDELLRRHAAGQRVLLVIDEAHAMPAESLEEVRLLSNLETGQHKLVNIMLFGQPELDGLLAEPRLRQVRDRVIHRFELPPWLAAEVTAYIDHRLRAAGWHGAGLFAATAMTRLVKASQGRARRINLLADKALLAAYADGARTVQVKHVASAVRELPLENNLLPAAAPPRWHMVAWTVGLASVMTALTVSALGWYRGTGVPLAQNGAATTTATVAVSALKPAPVRVESAPAPAPAPATVAPMTAASKAPTSSATASPVSRPASTAAAVTSAAPAVTPSNEGIDSTKLNAVLARTRVWLREADPGGYTIQLAALPSTIGLDAYLAHAAAQLDASKVYAQYSVYKGRTYVSVYLGNYDSHRAAALAIEALPASLRSNRPLVRTWTKIKQDQQP